MKRLDLLQFALQVLALGVCVGLLGHFADYGWNAGTPLFAKCIMIIGTVFLFLIVLVQFFALSKT